MQQKRLRRLIDIKDDVVDEILFDKQRLSQVLVNLLSNAVKFTFEGFIKVKIQRVH
jgi:signal transduction histidine kinase